MSFYCLTTTKMYARMLLYMPHSLRTLYAAPVDRVFENLEMHRPGGALGHRRSGKEGVGGVPDGGASVAKAAPVAAPGSRWR